MKKPLYESATVSEVVRWAFKNTSIVRKGAADGASRFRESYGDWKWADFVKCIDQAVADLPVSESTRKSYASSVRTVHRAFCGQLPARPSIPIQVRKRGRERANKTQQTAPVPDAPQSAPVLEENVQFSSELVGRVRRRLTAKLAVQNILQQLGPEDQNQVILELVASMGA